MQVTVVPVLAHRYEVPFILVLVRRRVVLVLVLMFVRVCMGMIVRMRVHQVPVPMRVLVGVDVIVRVLVGMHVAVLSRMVVIVRHDQSSLVGSLQHAPHRRRLSHEITSTLRTARSR